MLLGDRPILSPDRHASSATAAATARRALLVTSSARQRPVAGSMRQRGGKAEAIPAVRGVTSDLAKFWVPPGGPPSAIEATLNGVGRALGKLSATALCLLLAVVFVDYCSGPDRAEMLTQLWEDFWAELWDICSSSVHLGLLTAISVC